MAIREEWTNTTPEDVPDKLIWEWGIAGRGRRAGEKKIASNSLQMGKHF